MDTNTSTGGNATGNGATAPSGAGFNPDFGKLIDRLKKLVTDTDNAWSEIKGESADAKSLYLNYFLVVFAIAPVSMFIGKSILGDGEFFSGIMIAIRSYVVGLISVYVGAFIAQKISTYFEGNCTIVDTLKWYGFSAFPSCFIGIIGLVPSDFLQLLQILGLYSVYVAWLGVTKMTGVPESKRAAYFITLIGVGVVLGIVLMALLWPAGHSIT